MRILDLTRLLPGDLATQLLADLGAEVIKVEEPEVGDYMRHLGPMLGDVGYPFLLLNQGKKSLAVDLKTEEGRDLFYRLVPTADVVVEQFRPGVAERLGVGYEQVRAHREDLVYCSFSGFGTDGPYRDRPAHDVNFTALSGALHMTAREGVPTLPGVPVADVTAAFLCAFALVAALRARDRTGRGQYVDLAIFDAALHLNVLNLAEVFGGREPEPGATFPTGLFPFYDLYATSDGRYVSLGALEEKFWNRFCDLVGRPEWRPLHLATGEEAEALRRSMASLFRSRTLEEWGALLAEEVPFAPVRKVGEVPGDPQVQARRLVGTMRWEGQTVRHLRHPVRWSPARPERDGPPPRLGEHALPLLEEVGLTRAEVEDLAARGILRLP